MESVVAEPVSDVSWALLLHHWGLTSRGEMPRGLTANVLVLALAPDPIPWLRTCKGAHADSENNHSNHTADEVPVLIRPRSARSRSARP